MPWYIYTHQVETKQIKCVQVCWQCPVTGMLTLIEGTANLHCTIGHCCGALCLKDRGGERPDTSYHQQCSIVSLSNINNSQTIDKDGLSCAMVQAIPEAEDDTADLCSAWMQVD